MDTGDGTATGGRLRRTAHHLGEGPFCLTYGDGVSDVDITAKIAYHRSHGRLATVTAVQPPGRYGNLQLTPQDDAVRGFSEKPPEAF